MQFLESCFVSPFSRNIDSCGESFWNLITSNDTIGAKTWHIPSKQERKRNKMTYQNYQILSLLFFQELGWTNHSFKFKCVAKGWICWPCNAVFSHGHLAPGTTLLMDLRKGKEPITWTQSKSIWWICSRALSARPLSEYIRKQLRRVNWVRFPCSLRELRPSETCTFSRTVGSRTSPPFHRHHGVLWMLVLVQTFRQWTAVIQLCLNNMS